MAKKTEKHKRDKKPPITEAVIEVRFTDKISDTKLNKLFSKQKSQFTVQKLQAVNIKVAINPDNSNTEPLGSKLLGYKLIEKDDNFNIIQYRHNSFSISRLAPYQGWNELLKTFKKNYELYIKDQHRPISRIGMRFINRIDVPTKGKKIKIENYFNIFPNIPKAQFPSISDSSYMIQTTLPVDEDHTLTVNSYRYGEEILIGYVPIVLDLDVARIKNLPTSIKNIYNELETLREYKDNFFETLITEECWELFE